MDSLAKTLNKLGFPESDKVDYGQLQVTQFSEIVSWISQRLNYFSKTESIVQVVCDETDTMSLPSLKLELNSLLKEVGSVYADRIDLENSSQRLRIVKSLAGDLLAAQIKYLKAHDEEFSLTMNPRKDVENIAHSLSLSTNFANSTEFFQRVSEKVQQNPERFQSEKTLFLTSKFTEDQWDQLKNVNDALNQEYSIRREMMLRRLDTTIASFTWKKSDKKQDEIKPLYGSLRKKLTSVPRVSLSHLLASRSSDFDKLLNERISTNHENCVIVAPSLTKIANEGALVRLELHKVIIGDVPDRGGRPEEQPMPKRDNFSNQRGQRDHFRRGGGGGGRGGGRGGFHNQQQNNNFQQRKNIPADNGQRVQGAGWQANDAGDAGYNSQAPSRRNRDQFENNEHQRGGRRGGGRGRYN